MASDVLTFIREKDPRFKDVPDSDLTSFIGDKHPEFLQDQQFAKRFSLVKQQKYARAEPEPSKVKAFGEAMAEPPDLLKPASDFLEAEKPETQQSSGIQAVVSGLERAGIGLAQGAMSRAGIATIAGSLLPGVGPAIAATGAAGFGGKTILDSARPFVEAVKNGDVGAAAEHAANMVIGASGIVGGAKIAKDALQSKSEPLVTPDKAAVLPMAAAELKKNVPKTPEPETPKPSEETILPKTETVEAKPAEEVTNDAKEEEIQKEGDGVLNDKQGLPTTATEVPASEPPEDAQNRSLGIAPKLPQFIQNMASLFTGGNASKAWNATRTSIAGAFGKTLPKTTLSSKDAGEAGARYLSSRIAAPYMADAYSSEVLNTSGVDPVKFGAALTEDNLRSVKKGFADAGEVDKANNVKSLIGPRGPFNTEAEYQAYLQQPDVQQAIAAHKQLWDQTVDPMYKQAMDIDPNEVLPTRGLQTDARINLFVPKEGETIAPSDRAQAFGGANLTATFKRKSPFGIQAKGSSENYGINYKDIIANTFHRQLEIANKAKFDDALVKAGDAVIDRPGQQLELKGEPTKVFPYKRQRVIFPTEEGTKGVSQNQNIYVRRSLSGEYERAANVTGNQFPNLSKITNPINQVALAGLTDATVHVSNLGTALFTRPGGNLAADVLLSAFGRSDIPLKIVEVIKKSFNENRDQLSELAQIGALREYPKSKSPLANLVHWADKHTRLVLDDTYKKLSDAGIVENSETSRREFVNQAGQYNKRAQGSLTRMLRDTGIGPFVTAGKTFIGQGYRNVAVSPGVKATSPMNAAKLRADVLSKWLGFTAFVATANYVLTHNKGGGVTGRAGTPIGRIDTGMNDQANRPLTIPIADIVGYGRALRVSGIKGYADAKRKGLPEQVAIDASARDLINSFISPVAGPPVRLAVGASTGYPTAVNVGRQFPVVPPGKSQKASDALHAVGESSPILSSIIARNEPGGTWQKAVQKQLPRMALQPIQPEQMIAKYPEIVRKAQVNEYINDVIKRARYMKQEDRDQFVSDSLNKIDRADKTHAERLLQERRIVWHRRPPKE